MDSITLLDNRIQKNRRRRVNWVKAQVAFLASEIGWIASSSAWEQRDVYRLALRASGLTPAEADKVSYELVNNIW